MTDSPTQNPTLVHLLDALRDAPVIRKSRENYYGRPYATLEDLLVVRPALLANGLLLRFSSAVSPDPALMRIVASVCHADGEPIEAVVDLPRGEDPQRVGSALSYGRRYALEMLLGVCATDDDDANHATHGAQSPRERESGSGGTAQGLEPAAPQDLMEKPLMGGPFVGFSWAQVLEGEWGPHEDAYALVKGLWEEAAAARDQEGMRRLQQVGELLAEKVNA